MHEKNIHTNTCLKGDVHELRPHLQNFSSRRVTTPPLFALPPGCTIDLVAQQTKETRIQGLDRVAGDPVAISFLFFVKGCFCGHNKESE